MKIVNTVAVVCVVFALMLVVTFLILLWWKFVAIMAGQIGL